MEDDKVSPANKKKQLKTPAQVTALERFYNGHQYPSKEMKAQLAEQIGLTEMQVSSWFCGRRSKDKRLGRDKQVSGLRQESCGSTNIAYCRLADPREAESGHPSLDTSSESSSSGNEALEAKNSRLASPVVGWLQEHGECLVQIQQSLERIVAGKIKMQQSLMDMLVKLHNQDTTRMNDAKRAIRASLMDSIGKRMASL